LSSEAAHLPVPFPIKLEKPLPAEILTSSASEQPEDEALLLSIKSGDREALGIFFKRYARLVMSIGMRILHDVSEAEDLVHDVFLLVLNKAELFDPAKGPARAWLAKISYHQALDRRSYLVRRSFYDTRNGLDSESEAAISNHRSEIELVELSYWQSVLQRSFDCLSVDQRTTIELHFFEGFSINEISEQLQTSIVNVRHYFYRGLERLRHQMCSRFDEVGHNVVPKSQAADLKGNSK
jgi:RNA polymerase sigma-70 factor, ECF subfamily